MFVDWLLNGLWTSQPMGISPLSTTGQQLHADCLKVSHFEEKKDTKREKPNRRRRRFFWKCSNHRTFPHNLFHSHVIVLILLYVTLYFSCYLFFLLTSIFENRKQILNCFLNAKLCQYFHLVFHMCWYWLYIF